MTETPEEVLVVNPDELFQMKARARMAFPVAELKCNEPSVQPEKKMVESVRLWGVLVPLAIREDGTVIAGRRRWKAAQLAGRKTVPVIIFADDVGDDAVISLIENTQRRENPVNELHHLEALLDRKPPYTFERIKDMTGMSGQKLARLLVIKDDLMPNLRRAFNDGLITVKVAEACAKRPLSFQRRMLVLLEEQGTLSLKDVKEAGKVSKKAAVADLPNDLFGEVDKGSGAVQRRVKDLLEEALEMAGDNKTLTGRIKKALEVCK